MSFSLNEIEVTARKAARGAGYPWGIAEEAGKAVRWLCAQGLDGCGALACLLERGFAADLAAHTPLTLEGTWSAGQGLCPLIAGTALSDNASQLVQAPRQLSSVTTPLLLLPFLATSARRTGTPLSMLCPDALAQTDGISLSLDGAPGNGPADVTIRAGERALSALPTQTRAAPDPQAWDSLNRFAHRTYAPATEESRLLGAGAGLTDND